MSPSSRPTSPDASTPSAAIAPIAPAGPAGPGDERITSSSRAGAWLQHTGDQLAEIIAARHGVGTVDQPVDKALFEHNRMHVAYLEQAVSSGQAVLFENYVVWARVLAEHRNKRPGELEEDLLSLGALIREVGPDEVVPACTDLLEGVLAGFHRLPTEIASFVRPEHPHGSLARQYLDLLLKTRRREASELILEAVEHGTSLRDIYLDVFQAVQYEIGRLWQLNEITVAQEHFCTAATQTIMAQLYSRLFESERNGRRLVTACVSGDLHEIGARILTDFFEMEGWDTFYAGANTPTESLVQSVAGADLVALSATMVTHLPLIEEAIRELRKAAPDVPVIVGGYPFMQAPELCAAVGADATAVNAEEAVAVASKLLAG